MIKISATRNRHSQKAGDHMLAERELNVDLLDKLDLLERLEMADREGGYEKIKQQLAFEKKCVERKLYQQPPLTQPASQQ